MAIFHVESIQKQFGKIPVLRDISFDLERGQALSMEPAGLERHKRSHHEE